MLAAWARAGYRELAAMGRSAASQVAGDCRQDQVSQAVVNLPARAAAAWSRAGANGRIEASDGATAAGRRVARPAGSAGWLAGARGSRAQPPHSRPATARNTC